MRPAAYFIFVLVIAVSFITLYARKEGNARRRGRKEDELDFLNYDWDEWDDDIENTVEEFEGKGDSGKHQGKKIQYHGKFDHHKDNEKSRHDCRHHSSKGNEFENERPRGKYDANFEYPWEYREEEFLVFRRPKDG